MFILFYFTLYLYILINCEFCLIVQQKLTEASDVALNHYNETQSLEMTLEEVPKVMSTVGNNKHAMLFFDFTKQLAIAQITLIHAFFEEVKHHWGSFSVPEMLQEKLHHVTVSNKDASEQKNDV